LQGAASNGSDSHNDSFSEQNMSTWHERNVTSRIC
jgi:hypothetical protein